jgi:hypothetical protein
MPVEGHFGSGGGPGEQQGYPTVFHRKDRCRRRIGFLGAWLSLASKGWHRRVGTMRGTYRSSTHINQKVNNGQGNPTAKIAALLFCISMMVIVVHSKRNLAAEQQLY